MPIPKDPEKARLWYERQHIAQVGKSRNVGKSNPFFGKHHSEEQKCRWSIERKGKNPFKVTSNYLPKNLTKELLVELYHLYSVDYIAKKLNVTTWYVQKALRLFNIPVRTPYQWMQLANQGRKHKYYTYMEGYKYIRAPSHYKASAHGYVPEHLIVWEQEHKQQLPIGYVIHHLNGIKDDNRPENLVALPKNKHHYALLLQGLQKRIQELESKIQSGE